MSIHSDNRTTFLRKVVTSHNLIVGFIENIGQSWIDYKSIIIRLSMNDSNLMDTAKVLVSHQTPPSPA